MNNAQFRHLLETPRQTNVDDGNFDASNRQVHRFGSRARSVLMTPRSLRTKGKKDSSEEFSRLVTQQTHALRSPRQRSRPDATVPKGTKFGAGYQDRAALLRQEQSSEKDGVIDEKADRIKALEDMVRLQQIDQTVFEKLRDEIGVGGEMRSTHLVKGLDWKLLQKIRCGEDISNTMGAGEEQNSEDKRHAIDEELERVLEHEVQPSRREEKVRKGAMPPSSLPVSEGPMSRDDILKRLKANRVSAPQEASERVSAKPSLGSKFRKIEKQHTLEKKKFIETVDGRKREVLLIANPDGTTKRKVRWIDKENPRDEPRITLGAGEALGMRIPPEMAAKQRVLLEKAKEEEEKDQDIFDGVGTDYDPLGTSECESDEASDPNADRKSGARQEEDQTSVKPTEAACRPQNYFSTAKAEEGSTPSHIAPVADPKILAALRKTAAIREAKESSRFGKGMAGPGSSVHEEELLERWRKREREDAADLDLGFGESRFKDEEDEEGPIWNGEGAKCHKAGRKRGPKKRKANKDEIRDVTSVLEKGKG